MEEIEMQMLKRKKSKRRAMTLKDACAEIKAAARSRPYDARKVLLMRHRDADTVAIRRRFRYLARRLHPDKNSDSAECAEAFKLINDAYHDLMNDPRPLPPPPPRRPSAAVVSAVVATTSFTACGGRLWAGPNPKRARHV